MTTPITASIDPRFLDKVDRVFDAAPTTVWNELIQNSRRAGATEVVVRVTDLPPDEDGYSVEFDDNGRGITDPAILLRLAAEGWDHTTEENEDPAGMGFFCMSNFERVEVTSQGWSGVFTPDVFRGKGSMIPIHEPPYEGTTIKWIWRGKNLEELRDAFRESAQYCGLNEVRFTYNGHGEKLIPKDFLHECDTKLVRDGWAAGVEATGRYTYLRSAPLVHVNFKGVQLSLHPDSASDGTMAALKEIEGLKIDVRVDIDRVGDLQLVLPARNAIKHNEARDKLALLCEEVIYMWVASRRYGVHSLPYSVYKRAKDEFGIDIGEAKQQLVPWGTEWINGRELKEQEKPIVVSKRCCDTVARVHFECGKHGYTAYSSRAKFEGYKWYDALPVIEKHTILVDGKPVADSEVEQDLTDCTDGRVRVVDDIKVRFDIKGAEDLEYEVYVAVLGEGFHSYYDSVDEETVILVAKAVGDSRSSCSIASTMVFDMLFLACTDGEDPPSVEDQETDFEDNAFAHLLQIFFGKVEGLRHQLIRALRHLPWDCTRGDCHWTIHFHGGETPQPVVTSFNLGEKEEAANHKLVCFISKDSEIIYEVTSRKELTPERLINYMKKEHDYEDREDGDDWITHDPAGVPIDLDEWEANQNKESNE